MILNAMRSCEKINTYCSEKLTKYVDIKFIVGEKEVIREEQIDPLLDYPELLGILVNILKTENSQNIRRQTVTLIGILGAIDPYRQKEREVTSTTDISTEQNAPPIDIALLMQGMSPSNDEYYTTVVIHCLLKILKDRSYITPHLSRPCLRKIGSW